MTICQSLLVFLQSSFFALSAHAETASRSTINLKEVLVTGALLYGDQFNAIKTPPSILDVEQSVVMIINSAEIKGQGYGSV